MTETPCPYCGAWAPTNADYCPECEGDLRDVDPKNVHPTMRAYARIQRQAEVTT